MGESASQHMAFPVVGAGRGCKDSLPGMKLARQTWLFDFHCKETHMKPSSTASGAGPAGRNPQDQQQRKDERVKQAGIEPSTESQVDIANRVQQGIKDANTRTSNKPDSKADSPDHYDGNPAAHADADGGVLKPADDTPAVLRKRSGPRE